MRHLCLLMAGALLLVSTGTAAQPTHLLTNKQAKELIVSAKTPADHMRLARYFEGVAAKYDADSKEHSEMAEMYRAKPTTSETKHPMAPDTAEHCKYFADSLAKAAQEARFLAAAHEKMAQ